MIALTTAGVTVVAVWIVVAAFYAVLVVGLGCLLSDAWRHDRDLKRRPEEKRPMNRQRLARLHVIEDARPVRVTPSLERMPAGYKSPPYGDPVNGLVRGDRLVDGFWTKPDGRVWTGSEWL